MSEFSSPKSSARWFGVGLAFLGWVYLIHAARPLSSCPPRECDAFSARLGELLASGKLEEADALSQRYLSNPPPSAQTYLQIGRIYFEHDQWQRAATFLRKSLELQNQDDRAHLLLGLALGELKRTGEAERELLLAVQQNPRSDTNCYMAGRVLLLRGKYESALPYFYKALELNSKNLNAFQALAQTLARTGSYGLAETYDKKAIEIVERTGSREIGPYLDLAFLLLLDNRKEDASRALEYARTAREIDPQSADARLLSGKALLKLERYPEARDELLAAARLTPQDARLYYLLSQIYQHLGKPQEAQAARRTYARLNKRRADEAMRSSGLRP